MLYANYLFYKEEYGGNALIETDFNTFSLRAQNFVNNLCGSQINEQNISDDIKFAICNAAEVFYEIANSAPSDVAAENTDGYSISYQTAQNRQKAQNARLVSAVNMYFAPSHPLRYRGAQCEKPH